MARALSAHKASAEKDRARLVVFIWALLVERTYR
jgi:hypothetical protein